MARPACSEIEFVELFETYGGEETARRLGINVRTVQRRRAHLEKKLRRQITGPDHPNRTRHNVEHPHRIEIDIQNGVVLIGSDAHYWPNRISTAHRAFVKFCKEFKPRAVIMNGRSEERSE